MDKITINGNCVELTFPDDEAEKINFFRNSKELPIDELAKYYLNEDLNFLCGSGTSVSLGGKTINSGAADLFEEVINDLDEAEEEVIVGNLRSDKLLEDKLDSIYQDYLYHLNVKNEDDRAQVIKEIFDRLLKLFIESYVPLPKDYLDEKLNSHTLFINKIISRRETLNRPKVFTPNYDLAFENACEKISASYNNGFVGTHLRKFAPDIFENEIYVKQRDSGKNKKVGNYLSLFKLHGSISWKHSEYLDDLYKISESQISDSTGYDDLNYDSLVIYPVQAKKSYSLDLPYSELFRLFSKSLTESQNTLVIIGYSFLDEHINDIIRSGLYNPNMTLIIHSYEIINDDSADFLKKLKDRSLADHRLIIFEGNNVSSFENIVKHLIPLNSYRPSKDHIVETLKELLKNGDQ